MKFEWDKNKELANLKKHSISFSEAATVFGDILSITFFDPDHSKYEHRNITIGTSKFNKILVIAHTDRGNITRIISARKVTRTERKYYENETR